MGRSTRKPATFEAFKTGLRQLYEGENARRVRFRYALFALDIVTVLFIIATSFLPRDKAVESMDVIFGIIILADFSLRLIISRHPLRDFPRLSTWTDIVVIISFLAPFTGEAGGFLRAFRTLRLLRDYQMVERFAIGQSVLSEERRGHFCRREPRGVHLRHDGDRLRDTEVSQSPDRQLCRCALLHRHRADHDRLRRPHLAGHAGAADHRRHHDLRRDPVPESRQGIVRTLQGSVLLPGLRPAAGHDADAVHCKACGTVLNIPDEGLG